MFPREARENTVGTLRPTVQLRRIGGRTVPYAFGRPLPGVESQRERSVMSLAGGWRRQRVAVDHELSLTDRAVALPALEREARGRHRVDHDDRAWTTHRVPSPDNALSPASEPGGVPTVEPYEDGVWYRCAPLLPVLTDGHRLRLTFLAVNYVADVWVNGRWVGYHEGGYSPFSMDVTDLVVAGQNVVAVRVDNPPWGTRADTVPAVPSDWWNYTGILQDVWLEWLPATSVARVDVVWTAEPAPGTGARFAATVAIQGAHAATAELTVRARLAEAVVTDALLETTCAADLEGTTVPWRLESPREVVVDAATGDGVAFLTGTVAEPRQWTPQTPDLYVLTVELRVGGGVIEEFATQTGARTVAVAAGSPTVMLNGRPVAFQGMARHEDWADTGRTVASPLRVIDDLLDIRRLGATLLRTAHYPNHPLTYLAADRIGLAVAEEIPTWWFEDRHFAAQRRRGIAEQMWREMVFRDYNRPSVLFWSGTNESISVHPRAEFLRHVVSDLRENYDDGRLVTQSAAPDRPGATDPSQSVVDVAGWTTYFGIFCGEPGQEAELTERFLAQAHAAHPDKPILVTEFGMWAREDDGLVERQHEVFDRTWPVYERHLATRGGFLVGNVWWAAYDWHTPIAGFNTFGLSHLDRGGHRPVRAALSRAYQMTPLFSDEWEER